MAAIKSITDYIRKMMAKKTRISPRDRAVIQLFMQKRISPCYRAAMRSAYTRMAADKSIVNHIQGMKIVKVANPNIEKGKAVIRLNPMQYLYFKKDMMNGLRFSKEAVKISRTENLETAYKYLSNAAVLCGSSELGASLIRAGTLLYKTDKEFTEKALKTSLFGREDEESYAYLKEVHSSLRTVRYQVETMVVGQKKSEAPVKKEQEDQVEKEVDGAEDKFKSAPNTSGNRNKNGEADRSGNGKGNGKDGNGKGNGKDESGGSGSGSGSGTGNGNGNGDSFGSLLEKIQELF